MKPFPISLLVCLLVWLNLPALASEVYVGNQPYQGQVMGAGTGLRFVLSEVAESLELEAAQSGEVWTLGGVPVSTRLEDELVWVEVSALPAEFVRVVQSPALNTVDLYRIESVQRPDTQEWGDKGTVVYFYADWSPACQAMERSIQMLEQSSTIRLARLNVDNPDSYVFRKYVKLFKGDKIPHFVLLNSRDRKIDSFSGFLSYNELLKKLRDAYSG